MGVLDKHTFVYKIHVQLGTQVAIKFRESAVSNTTIIRTSIAHTLTSCKLSLSVYITQQYKSHITSNKCRYAMSL